MKNKTLNIRLKLYNKINSDKYIISTEFKNQYDSPYYLFNECESRNEAVVKFLLEHNNIMMKGKKNNIALSKACESGNLSC